MKIVASKNTRFVNGLLVEKVCSIGDGAYLVGEAFFNSQYEQQYFVSKFYKSITNLRKAYPHNYFKMHTSLTPLSDLELRYCEHDVKIESNI